MTAIVVKNLATQEERTYVGITAREAVIAAYAQVKNRDYNTWEYKERYGNLVETGEHTVLCGDWSALKEPNMKARERVKITIEILDSKQEKAIASQDFGVIDVTLPVDPWHWDEMSAYDRDEMMQGTIWERARTIADTNDAGEISFIVIILEKGQFDREVFGWNFGVVKDLIPSDLESTWSTIDEDEQDDILQTEMWERVRVCWELAK